MSNRTPEQIYHDLAEVMAAAFPNHDISTEMGSETRVFADLGLTSIELVVLGERVEQFYGRRLPFGPFLAGLRARGADDLELGEVVAFLQRHV
ncbi:acyl carrier protein [Fimbriiglobus ruber]|nr:acyl carrier protein [Fimbriiglobus ruber]